MRFKKNKIYQKVHIHALQTEFINAGRIDRKPDSNLQGSLVEGLGEEMNLAWMEREMSNVN